MNMPEEESQSTSMDPTLSTTSKNRREHKSHHVLVVDDALLNRKMLIRLLERAGHQCSSAANGREAIAVYDEDRAMFAQDPENHRSVNCVLMDYEMPIMNGPDATKALREKGCTARIIGVSGNVLEEDVAYFKSMGAEDVLAKPVNLSLLEDCWEKYGIPE